MGENRASGATGPSCCSTIKAVPLRRLTALKNADADAPRLPLEAMINSTKTPRAADAEMRMFEGDSAERKELSDFSVLGSWLHYRSVAKPRVRLTCYMVVCKIIESFRNLRQRIECPHP